MGLDRRRHRGGGGLPPVPGGRVRARPGLHASRPPQARRCPARGRRSLPSSLSSRWVGQPSTATPAPRWPPRPPAGSRRAPGCPAPAWALGQPRWRSRLEQAVSGRPGGGEESSPIPDSTSSGTPMASWKRMTASTAGRRPPALAAEGSGPGPRRPRAAPAAPGGRGGGRPRRGVHAHQRTRREPEHERLAPGGTGDHRRQVLDLPLGAGPACPRSPRPRRS